MVHLVANYEILEIDVARPHFGLYAIRLQGSDKGSGFGDVSHVAAPQPTDDDFPQRRISTAPATELPSGS